jgi:hypothetical protein
VDNVILNSLNKLNWGSEGYGEKREITVVQKDLAFKKLTFAFLETQKAREVLVKKLQRRLRLQRKRRTRLRIQRLRLSGTGLLGS